MGCRTWWGKGDLRDRDLGGYRGEWLFGVNGPPPGRYDLAFEEWCRRHRLPYVRTVEVFWTFQYHRDGFPRRLDIHGLRESWKDEKDRRRRAAAGLLEPPLDDSGGVIWIRLAKHAPERVPWSRLAPNQRKYLDDFYPDPRPWEGYYRREKKYFACELARYKRVLKFWRRCGHKVRRTFLRCAAFSNRRPESHPDYFVASPRSRGSGADFGFVEVKGPRESLRPSQRRFFPELVRRAEQKIWLARFTMAGDGFSFGQFTARGQLVSCDSLFGLG